MEFRAWGISDRSLDQANVTSITNQASFLVAGPFSEKGKIDENKIYLGRGNRYGSIDLECLVVQATQESPGRYLLCPIQDQVRCVYDLTRD